MKGNPAVPHDGDRHTDIFPNGRGVNVNVNNLSLWGKGIDLACDAIIEAHADGDQEITLGRGHVGAIGAVHADHAQPERV